MKKAVFALVLGATAMVGGTASAHSWHKHGKTCFVNKWGKVHCVRKHGHFKHNKHRFVIVKRNHFVGPKFYGY